MDSGPIFGLRDSDNEFDYRCDPFKKNHQGKHILFIGDSFAAGDGLDKEDTWCHKIYSRISKEEPTSGYFNIGISGSSTTESIDQFFKYCHNYGNPNVVFFVTTEFHREQRHVYNDFIYPYIFNMYLYLEQYCKSNNIKLYSFSWVKSIDSKIGNPVRHVWNYEGKKMLRPLWTEQGKDGEPKQRVPEGYPLTTAMQKVYSLNNFSSYCDYSSKDMLNNVFEFDKKTTTPKKSLWAEDDCHPGTSFHDFYADFMYNAFKKDQ